MTTAPMRFIGMMGFSTTLAVFCRFVGTGHDRPRFAGAPSVGVARCRHADRNDAHRSWVMDGFDPSCRARCVQQSTFLLLPPRTACAATGDTRGAASVGQDPCHADPAGASLRSSSPVLPSRCATDHSTVSSNDRGWCQRQNILNRWLIWRGTHTDEHNQSAANFLLRVSFLFCVFNVRWIFFLYCLQRTLQKSAGSDWQVQQLPTPLCPWHRVPTRFAATWQRGCVNVQGVPA